MADKRYLKDLSPAEMRRLQRDLNRFTQGTKTLKHLTPLIADGENGRHTQRRVRLVKFFLGFLKKNCNTEITDYFLWRLDHPWFIRKGKQHDADLRRRKRGRRRRRKEYKEWLWNRYHGYATFGVTTFDGKPVAKWLKPYLIWARDHGWKGTLASGYRTPAYSEHLCYQICGMPSCPGLCAGRSSKHTKHVKPDGALDVTDYLNFARIIRGCPLSPRIFNALPKDLVHFSATGH